MRHFRSVLYAVVLAPAVWVLVAVGLTHDLTARGRDGFAVESFTGLLMLLLGGAAYGILVFAPISPLGPTLTGVLFLGTGVWAIASPSSYAAQWPSGVVKDGFDLSRPGYGLAALLAVPMIATVLSVRRWRGFEPLVLPIVGQVGRARGAAAAPGTPMAAMETDVLPVEAEQTTWLHFFEQPGSAPPVSAAPVSAAPVSAAPVSASQDFDDPASEERTTLLRAPSAPSSDEPTTVVRRPVEGEVTTVLRPREEPVTVALPDERPTEDVRSSASEVTADVVAEEETTTVIGAAGHVVEDEPATVFVVQPDAADEESVAPPGNAEADEPTAIDVAETDSAEGAADEPAESVVPESAADSEEPAASADDEPAASTDDQGAASGRPPLEGPGERTVDVLPRVNGETTQIIGSPGEETRIIMRRDGDQTQVIRPPDDGERTQLLEAARKAASKGPDRGGSIAGAESPNFADDPTGRLQVPAEKPEEPVREMTVMNVERPPEDVPRIPAPRRSPESDD